MNFSYFDKQYGQILDVQRNRQLRKRIRTRIVELHKSGRKWEILNYHMQVICKENDVMKTTTGQELEAYAEREETYLMITVLLKMFKRMDLVNENHPDYKHFQALLSTIFWGHLMCYGIPLVVTPNVLGPVSTRSLQSTGRCVDRCCSTFQGVLS